MRLRKGTVIDAPGKVCMISFFCRAFAVDGLFAGNLFCSKYFAVFSQCWKIAHAVAKSRRRQRALIQLLLRHKPIICIADVRATSIRKRQHIASSSILCSWAPVSADLLSSVRRPVSVIAHVLRCRQIPISGWHTSLARALIYLREGNGVCLISLICFIFLLISCVCNLPMHCCQILPRNVFSSDNC